MLNNKTENIDDILFGKDKLQLMESALITAKEVLKVKSGETALIIANPIKDSLQIAWALYYAIEKEKGEPAIALQEIKSQLDFANKAVIGAIKSNPDIIISISANKLGKDLEAIKSPYKIGEKSYDSTFHYLVDGIKKSRSFWSPGITADIFMRSIPIDYAQLKKECRAIKLILDTAASIKVKSSAGTNITIPVEGRKAFCDDGNFSFPGAGGNLPAGEVFISPLVGKSNGTIVFDGSISLQSRDILIDNPIIVNVEKGYVTSIEGKAEAQALRETIEKGMENAILFETEGKLLKGKGEIYRKNSRNIGELGIGLNPKAKITGNMLEDEKANKTCHIAIGSNYDDDAPALIHLDGLIREPDITVFTIDGKEIPVMEKGIIKI
jgi:leucyl aminopeptidase (aminopeptidase T)